MDNNLIGKTFGKLTVIGKCENYVQPSGRIREMWKCKCECGNIKTYRKDALKRIISCGCLRNKDNAKRLTTHSESKTRLYKIYFQMIARCENTSNSDYGRYGGRGISVCKEWKLDKTSFFDWAYKNGYDKNNLELSLERVDVNGNYCPENCKWIKIKEQYNNMRKTIRIGDISLAEFCRCAGLKYSSVRAKYYKTKDIVYALGFNNQKVSR